jgi:hypothetical protein
MSKQLDFGKVETKAQSMSIAELHYAMLDCSKAAANFDAADRANGTDLAGYYRDELSVYHAEMCRRAA